jgi:hypothetical protein
VRYKYGNLTLQFGVVSNLRQCTVVLREEHRLGVFVNRVLTRIFGPKRDEVIGEWRKLNNEELTLRQVYLE